MTPSLFTQRIQAWFGVAVLAEMITTPRLWFVLPPDRPIHVPMLVAAPGWLHLLLGGLLAACAVALLIRPRHRLAPLIASCLLVLLCLIDELRLQPWAWLFMICGVLLFLARRRDGRSGDLFLAQHLRLLLFGLYLWAGLHKINGGFVEGTIPFFLEPLGFDDPGPALRAFAGTFVIVFELALAALLALAGKWERWGLWLAVAMHLVIVMLLGPAGQNYDPNVWTWNIGQAALLVLLLYKGPSSLPLHSLLAAKKRPTLVLAALVIAMPALHVVRLAPANLSWALYAGNYDFGLIAAQRSTQRPELDRAIPYRTPRFVDAAYRYLEPQLGPINDLRAYAYPPQIMKELGVTYPPDASFMRRLQRALCADLDPILILRAKHLPFVPTTEVSIERCDGSRTTTKMPPFLGQYQH